ncbi:hypothetical protein [Sorangium sp. So ce426]|uniref:hypothetical protein n=1 Tax=Sorangium sp. So ce426 TaxID=3133312 RepID=UPI003F5BD34C
MTADVMTRVAPLGLRFWDDVNRDLVRDGLAVSAWPESLPSRPRSASVNASGVWALHDLALMAAFERGAGDARYWEAVASGADPALSPRRPFVVEVRDTARRFLPVRLRVTLPVRGLYDWPAAAGLAAEARALSAGAPPGVIPLPVAPSRPVRALAVVRAELAVDGDEPAASALVEVFASGRLVGRGMSDERGRVAVIFPYPDTLVVSSGSPLGSPSAGASPSEWRWNIEVVVRYAPPAAGARRGDAPELAAVFAQPPTTALLRLSPEEPLRDFELRHRDEQVLRTEGASDGRLWIRTVI